MTNGSRTFRATSSQSHLFFDCLSQVFPDAALLWAASLPTYILLLLTNSSLRYFFSELCLVWTISSLSHLFSAIPLSWATSFARYFLSELPLLLSLSSVRISSLSGFGYSRVLFWTAFPPRLASAEIQTFPWRLLGPQNLNKQVCFSTRTSFF